MKTRKSKYWLIAVIASASLLAVTGCSSQKNEKSSSTADSSQQEAVVKQPLTFSINESPTEGSSIGMDTSDALDAQDPTAPSSSGTMPPDSSASDKNEYITVTDAQGQNVTQYVPITDAEGNTSVNDDGQAETTVVNVTEAVISTNSSSETKTEASGSSYKPNFVSAQAYWFDISKDADFMFEGEFISVKFRIKDNAPKGKYDITITNPDFANYKNGDTVYPDKIANGAVYVSENGDLQDNYSNSSEFVVYADKISGKQGDEVTVNFYLKNNPGMCAMLFEFKYDRNALEILEGNAVGEFAKNASPSIGIN